MNTGFRTLLSAGLFQVIAASTLLLAPVTAPAQVLFGSGGATNTAAAYYNQAFGYQTLFSITSGIGNVANGFQALYSNTTGDYNIANGVSALHYNTTGSSNTANGYSALQNNTTGSNNTANGYQALASSAGSQGSYNTADGSYALASNAGSRNTANGYLALFWNQTGIQNTATGMDALYSNTGGNYNTADGYQALINSTGNENIALGYAAGNNLTTGSNNIDIGNGGVAGESGVIRIGYKGGQTATYIAGINGVNAGGVAVYINSNGQLGTVMSSRRFKNDIHDMGRVSDKLMQLRPVTFRYKQASGDGTRPLQYGLIAEEVAKVYPDLVQYDKSGKPFTIYYHLLTPMLLNELQKAHRQSEAQKAEITAINATHKAEIASLKSELAALKQSQQQQFAALAKLTALVQTSQNREPLQRAVYTQH